MKFGGDILDVYFFEVDEKFADLVIQESKKWGKKLS
jgi:hypothetical protein